MMKASVKGKYDLDNNAATVASVAFNAGDLKLRASITDATVVNGPCLNGLSLAVERPGFFIVNYDVPKKDFRFQFMNSVRVAEKPLNLTYIHTRGDNRTMLDGTLVIDSANKLSANHVFGSKSCKLKYSYLHDSSTTFEQSYDTGKNAWDFMVSRKVYGDDVLKGSYQTSTKNLGLEWSRSSKRNGSFKVAASVNMGEEKKVPKLTAETSWDFEM